MIEKYQIPALSWINWLNQATGVTNLSHVLYLWHSFVLTCLLICCLKCCRIFKPFLKTFGLAGSVQWAHVTAGGCKRAVKGWSSCATLVHLLPDLVVLEPQGLFGLFKEHTARHFCANKWFYRALSLGPSFCRGCDFSFLFGKVEFVSLLRLFFSQSCSHLLSHTNYIVTSQQRCLSQYHVVQPPPDTSARMLSKLSPGMRGQSLLIDHQCRNAR